MGVPGHGGTGYTLLTATERGERGQRVRRPRLGLSHDNSRIFFAMTFNEGAFGINQTLYPLFIAALGATPPQIGLVMGTAGIARLIALAPSGIIADRIPPRRLIVVARAMTMLGMLGIALSQRWWHLIPAGMVLATSNAAFPIISNTIAESAGTGRNRIRAFTLIYTVGPSFALLATPAMGGLVSDWFGLRAAFYLAALLAAIALVFFTMIHERPIPKQEGPPATYVATLAQRPILLICLLELSTIFVLTLGVTLVPNYLQDVHGISIGRIGLLGSMAALGAIVLGIAINRVRVFQAPLIAIGLSIASVAGTLMLMIVGGTLVYFALGYILRGGYFVAWSLFAAALGEVTPERYRARAFAMAEIMGGAGFAFAPFVAGWLYGMEPRSPLVVALILIAPLLLGLGYVARVIRSERQAMALAEERI